MWIPLGRGGWYICDAGDGHPGQEVELRGNDDVAAQWLRDFCEDADLTNEFRRVLDMPFGWEAWELWDQVAMRLAAGVWRLRRPAWKFQPGALAEKPDAGPAFPLDERRSSNSASSQSGEPPTFPNDADLAAIADNQREAAELGIPFCEECAKAAAARN